MMRNLKLLGILLLTVVLIGGFILPESSLAEGKYQLPPAPTEGEASKNPKRGEGSIETRIQATQLLMGGKSFISASGTTITVSGNTTAYSSVDTIAVNLYLQRWDSTKGQWVDVVYMGEFKDYNTSVVSGGKDVLVVAGYYYRTRALHWINEGGTVEQGNSTSTYIYVD